MSTKAMKPYLASKKSGTEPSRNFSYKSFSQKIASLKIDPVRRVRNYVDDEDTTKSFFKSSFDNWVELNLSATFTQFVREARPLCDSLPLIVHNKDCLFDILYTYIDKRDPLAVEPLLDLLSQLAHDLGATFELYLERSVSLLSKLVAKHVDVETIECTFNCLAYLLKYLSRLLVPDLRPLYNILAPLLGRENQKSFVVRFAAEALSFLIRKAKGESLRLIVRYAFEDLQQSGRKAGTSAYAHGLMTMFHEACISVDHTIHSRGPQVFGMMLSVNLEQADDEGACLGVVLGVLTGLVHHTSAETFQPILEALLQFIGPLAEEANVSARKIVVAARLLYTSISVRKGGRIQEWSNVGDTTLSLAAAVDRIPIDDCGRKDAMWHILKTVAVIIGSAEVDVVISKCSRIVEKSKDFQDGTLFLPFCQFVSELKKDRFSTFVMPHLQRFMSSQWSHHERSLCFVVPKLASAGTIQFSTEGGKFPDIVGPKSLISSGALQAFTSFTSTLGGAPMEWDEAEQLAIASWQYLDILATQLSVSDGAHVEPVYASLISLLKAASRHSEEHRLAPICGKSLHLISHYKPGRSEGISSVDLSQLILAFGNNSTFLNGVLQYLKLVGAGIFDEHDLARVSDSLILRLLSPSGDVRRLSLYVLDFLSKASAQQTSGIIKAAAMVEEIPLNLSNQRNVAMYVRKIGIDYQHVESSSWEYRIAPHYCFGLMTAKFAPLWEEATKVLAKVAERNEEMVADLAFNWLSGQGCGEEESQQHDEASPKALTAFECSNLKLLELSAAKCIADEFAVAAELQTKFAADSSIPAISIVTARAQALYVLRELPEIAEKRSRLLVPMLLEWSRTASVDADDDDDDLPDDSPSFKWSRQNQAAMLTLFSKFVNPKVLYRSDVVYSSLLRLLTSGDTKMQTLALKCIFTWKNPAIKSYEDQLTNLLDDTRFRDELTHFVQIDEDDCAIHGQHREALMPVLLRLLYGRSLSRKRASSGRKGMSSTRTAILAALANMRQEERAMFVDITLGELANLEFVDKPDPQRFSFNSAALGSVHFSLRKQVGLVRMFEDLFKQLGTTLLPHMPKMLDALLYCIVSSIEATKAQGRSSEDEDPAVAKALKAIRIGGFKSLNSMFHYCPTFSWKPYLPAVFGALIDPKLKQLPVDSSQNVSSLLQLFSTWASSKHTVLLLGEYNDQILATVAQSLGAAAVKDEVVLFIVQLVRKIVQHADNTEELEIASSVKDRLLRPNVDLLFRQLGSILRKSLGKDVLEQCIETVAVLAPHVAGNSETTQLVDISVFLLDQPTRRVNPKSKSEILKILVNFLPLCHMEKGDLLFERTFKTVSSLFGFFRDRVSRKLLASVLQVFAERDQELQEVAELSRKLNAFSIRRLDEPDFEQRLEAYAAINEQFYASFSAKQWMPLLHNMLFFIRDNEELAIRTNASYSLKRFAEVCGSKLTEGDGSSFVTALSDIVLPCIRAGAREQSEIIRAEYVGVMAHIVKECPTLESVSDMQSLLVGGDEEANFFNNVLHIQQHRRGRALRRLATLVKSTDVSSSNIAHFLLPLIEHFVFDQAEGEHNLANEAVFTIGALAEQLEWQQYRAVLKRFMSYIKSKPDLEKIVIRLIGTAVNALSTAWEVRANSNSSSLDADGDLTMAVEAPETARTRCVLSDSLPERQKLANDISNGFLPDLSEYLHQKEESTVSLRVPVAVSMIKLLKVMPEDMMKAKLPGTLTDVCHILRSRAQESRDMTRQTLVTIALLLGPEYFSFILKELRGALLRGYQLHVLSYTVHSILSAVVKSFPPGSLDYCVSSIVDIIMDDIFGVTGTEKDAEGYISKMKEVKSSMSYDSMSILATITTLPYLGNLVRPIRALLPENLTLKLVRKIDELLRRITIGLLENETVKQRNILVFCYEIIQEVYKEQSAEPKPETAADENKKRFIVNLKVPSKNAGSVATSSHLFKLIKFALDILRTILGKYSDLMTPENLAGFVPIMGDAVLSGQEEVQISALRLLTAIIRVPLSEIDDGAAVFMSKALSFIKSSPSTNSEIAQASLKLISAVLRERRNVSVKETTVGYILTRVKPDLEEPDRQGVTFNFLKSVMMRRIVVPEFYDSMDRVAAIMVTNQTRSVRDLARSLYVQFLMDYPQGQGRLKKQLAFLVKNLEYVHESGRKSVLDAIHLLVTKIGDKLIQEVVGVFFIPLVMVLVNDESADCREMTGTLLKGVFKRADSERQQTFLQLLRTWINQEQQPLLVRVALQVYGLFFEVVDVKGKREVSLLIGRLRELLSTANNEEVENPPEWQLIYFGLQLWSRLAQLFPETALSPSSADIWAAICGCVRFPHAWIRLTSARLLGLLFAEYSSSTLQELPLVNTRGLKLEGTDMIDIAYATSSQLNSPEITDELGLQVVKNLLFLARCFYASQLPAVSKGDDGATEEESGAKTALTWVIGRISGVIRNERNAKKGLIAKNMGKKYALQFLAAIIQIIKPEDLVPVAASLMMPLYNLIELPDASETKDLKVLAQETMSMLQSKVGTTEYAKAYNTVKQRVMERRQERRNKRKVEMVAEPEMAAKRKERKHERKKEVRKEKAMMHREFRRGKDV
ncbi:armadillo-type protein [Sphaerosporella brunnea]|uniref:Armadillo-type protein n=1 Tax=Sphaerosporella brunnea TaxID=1250544 RepID=A0A5J5F165_9PEZI|nr:armadillo-type protein [Sphaerosporella brunnea]